MEPDQQPEKDDQEKLQTGNEQKEENESSKKMEETSCEPEPLLTEISSVTDSSKDVLTEPVKTPETSKVNDKDVVVEQKEGTEQKMAEKSKQEEVKNSTKNQADENENKENSQENDVEKVSKSEGSSEANCLLPAFPGSIVTKSVPGSNDVKIEIDSNSLLDRVILYSLKNTVVDNSRLDAAKNKYMLNNGNITSSLNSNSNGSDSNSSSKSVEKLIEEFKGGCSKANNIEASAMEPNSDISNESSNGAAKCVNSSNKSPLGNEGGKSDYQNVTTSTLIAERTSIDVCSESSRAESCPLPESFPPKPKIENEALDFRDKTSPDAKRKESLEETSSTMLDLSTPHRDEKSVPPIKRNHALYVGLPDFSKQIFTAPSISRPTSMKNNQQQNSMNTNGPPKIRNPDFSNLPRGGATDLQMRHPDFSKGFTKLEAPVNETADLPVTPSNFPEIVRKNNYISDLQLKPLATATTNQNIPALSSSSSSPSSYKIDYRSSAAISQKLMQESKPEQPSTSQTVYPNMKKEGINAYNQQLIVDEPMAHIIHKNQFLPHTNDPSRVSGWKERNELGGAPSSSQTAEPSTNRQQLENEIKPQFPLPPHPTSSENFRKNHPAYFPKQIFKEKEFNNNSQESQLINEFSLKQKEQQLRQEGTIITVKNEPAKTPTREFTERRSADLFRDYKLKQPKESPDSARRAAELSVGYQQSYPDYPPSYPPYNHQTKVEMIPKPSHSSPVPPLAYPQERSVKQMPPRHRNYSSSSPGPYQQPKSPLTVPPNAALMNPPQNWPPPPPLVQQPPNRNQSSPVNGPSRLSSTSPSSYQYPSSQSQSPHANYRYPAICGYPPGPGAMKPAQNYQPYRNVEQFPSRSVDNRDVQGQHYQPPTSSSSSQNYYHQNYPDFSRHFDPEKKQLPQEHNANYSTSFIPIEHRQAVADANFQRFPPHHELEIRTVRDHHSQHRAEPGPSYYTNSREREPSNVQNYPPRVQGPVVNHHEVSSRLNEESYERSRGLLPLKVERKMEEHPKIHPGHSSISSHRRPEHSDISMIAKVKIEPAPTSSRNLPSTSTSSIIKTSKSIFAEVKRESPLDLSVKTVKTKADSTGCDQDIPTRHPEPSGLKVEFTPNFASLPKPDCRQQARQGPHDYPSSRLQQNVPERSTAPQKYANSLQNNVTPSASIAPTAPHSSQQQNQLPHASSSRNYFHDQRKEFQHLKEIERPRAPVQLMPLTAQYSERPAYVSDSKTHNIMEQQRSGPPILNKVYSSKEVSRSDEQFEPRRMIPHYPQQPSAPASAPYPVLNKPSHSSSTSSDSSRPPTHGSNPRDPLYYERERDRKYVEEILNRRKKNESLPPSADLRHFKPIVSPPRKRIMEQHHLNNSVPPKQVKFDEPARPILEPGVPPVHHDSPQFYRQFNQHRFPKVENHSKAMAIGQPPSLIQNNSYQKPLVYDTKYQPGQREDLPVANQQNVSSQYYPNPKAEMIHRSDPSSNYKQERLQFPNQNFQQRPDDITLQLYPRIHHPIQPESVIRNEHQTAGPIPGTSSGESARLINGIIPSSVSGSNGNIARGADQSTILKLKTNLELKEQKKLIIHKTDSVDDLDEQQKKDLSPRQFRTKGELKGFIPLPTSFDTKNVTTTASPALPTVPSAFDLLDWGSACNNFVQQLETGKKKNKKKRSVDSKSIDVKQDEKPLVIVPLVVPGISTKVPLDNPQEDKKTIEKKEEKNSSSDEDKPLLELLDATKTHKTVVEKISEKISRNAREKQRLELEQRHAARLGPSSSESETETRRPIRTALRVRRLRKRAALGIKKTDEEPSVEEDETEEETSQKRRTTRSISKIDDLTSSEDDEKKSHSKGKKSNDEGKTESISTKAGKRNAKLKQDTKKQESSSESSESDKASNNKSSKLSSMKSAKKLKDSGDSTATKKIPDEEKTMTRSKRKLEIERKLSNSKILRNEKIVQNVSPDKKSKIESPTSTKKILMKRKDSAKTEEGKRKPVESESDTNAGKSKKRLRRVSKVGSSSSSEEQHVEEENKAERLRPRKNKQDADTSSKVSKESVKKKVDVKATPTSTSKETASEMELSLPFPGIFPVKDEKASKFTPGWEADTYNYKRSLKIPAGLITIGRPPQHGVSHSLPDLDPQTSDTSEIFSEFVKSKDKDGSKEGHTKLKAESSKEQAQGSKNSNKTSSIIDLLHQRVVQSRRKFRAKKVSNVVGTSAQAVDDDLLPTPEKESEKVFGFKKNIFETSIITSRTRTENNALRKKEILKEVFGADDERPKSAPPVGAQNPDEEEKVASPQLDKVISYDQKYREYLEKMNVDFLTKSTDTSKTEDCKTADTSVKDEDDDDDDNETVVASEKDLVMPTHKGKVKKGRGRRCKGSSGFDYIRKKKRTAPNASENPLSVNNIIKKRLAAMENLENKDESDISKEIKGWVLNKGVGESVLHKASRLDYVDVIAYCLDRLNMNPDPKDNAGYTPLHEACSRGHLEIARILLQYGANHSETALSGIRPLHEAIENGHVEIVRLLISYGADPCLATYSGQMPIAMAEDKEMENFLSEYLIDIDNKSGLTKSWYFDGPFKVEDPSEEGYEVFDDIPLYKADLGSSVASVFSTSLTSLVTATTQMSDNETVISETTATPIKVPATPMKAPHQDLIKYQHKMKKCDTNSNNLVVSDVNNQESKKRETKSCSTVLSQIESSMKKIKKLPAIPKQEQITSTKLPEPIQKVEKHKEDYDDIMADADNLESDNEFLELEESEAPLPPLYLLRDEGSDKWILLTDLCNLLKVKSKDAVLKQICPLSPPASNKELIRELKMSDFLEKAICLQLFCAGEKLNVRASKVSLVRYNDSVRNLLGVQTIRMNM